jgi:methylthioribulose-1-phosphate dehydratase
MMMEKMELPSLDLYEATQLASLVREMNQAGHNPATSGNYSLRSKELKDVILISESGVDKNFFNEQNFLLVEKDSGNLYGPYQDSGRKPSDEMPIHLTIYKTKNANCVLHSHMLDALLIADRYPNEDLIYFENLELLKGFKGIKTHLTKVVLPVFENTQDMMELSQRVQNTLLKTECLGVLLRGHGIYIWGESVKEAKRHLEVFEYLFKYYLAKGKN